MEQLKNDLNNPSLPTGQVEFRREIAKNMADVYLQFYQPFVAAGTSVDIAAIDLNKDDNPKIDTKDTLIQAVEELAILLTACLENEKINLTNAKPVTDAIILSHWRAQSYKKETYCDLWDFCELLSKYSFTKLEKPCKRVQLAITNMVISARYYGTNFEHSHGLSIFFPWRDSDELGEYSNLKFSSNSKWGKFLKKYAEVTRRESRGVVNGKQPLGSKFIDIPAIEEGTSVTVQMNKFSSTPARFSSTPARFSSTPARFGLSAKSASMKNPPNGFYIDNNDEKEIL